MGSTMYWTKTCCGALNGSFARGSEGRSIQEGWEIVDVLVSDAKLDELAGRV